MPGFRDGPRGMWQNNGSGALLHWAFAGFCMLLLAALVATAIYAIVRFIDASRPLRPSIARDAPPLDQAESALRMRLATGEVSEEEYRSRLSALQKTP